jgi:hypothetical protein
MNDHDKYKCWEDVVDVAFVRTQKSVCIGENGILHFKTLELAKEYINEEKATHP